jgi:hypothetical protein
MRWRVTQRIRSLSELNINVMAKYSVHMQDNVVACGGLGGDKLGRRGRQVASKALGLR